MSDLTKILAENQKEVLKLIAPLNKKQNVLINAQDSDSETENVSVARTSTPVKTQTATSSKTTPVNSRNSRFQELLWIMPQCHLGRLWSIPRSPLGKTTYASCI